MNKIQEADFMMKFPPALQKDESMLALGKLIAEELHITANSMKKNKIYANIDELAETWLDVLAYDLHIDWYDYDYPVDIKRKLIKSSVKIHQKSGTRYAVQSVLQDVYRTAKVEEWFEYGGQPYTFRIAVDIGNEGLSEDTSREIAEKMQFYKNLRSHCEGVFYTISIEKAAVRTIGAQKTGGTLKVKPLLHKDIKAAGQNDIRAATFVNEQLKVPPLLDTEAKAGTMKAVAARIRALNSLKVKYYAPDILRAEMAEIGSVKAYHKGKLTMNIRKGQ